MRQPTLDIVGRFYSKRALYPLETLERGRIVVAEPSGIVGSEPAHRRWVLWMAVFPDRAVLIAPAEYTTSLREVVVRAAEPSDLRNPEVLVDLTARCTAIAADSTALRTYAGRKFCCDAGMLQLSQDANVHQLAFDNASRAIRRLAAVGIPDDASYLLAEDTAFAYFLDGEPVAFAGTHPAGDMCDRIGDVMVGVLEGYRRRGFGSSVVSATTQAVVARGKVAVWGMSHSDTPAMKTAESIGYQQYCELFELRCRT